MFHALRRRYREAMTSRVEFTPQAIRCIRGRGMLRPPVIEERAWASIDAVTVLKVDAYTTDCICLLFEGSAPLLAIEETMEGYQTLMEQLPELLPGIQPFEDWFLAVAFPAFEPNPAVIYRRV